MCLTEKIHMVDKLHSGLSSSTVGQQFNVDGLTVLNKVTLSRNTHKNKEKQGIILID